MHSSCSSLYESRFHNHTNQLTKLSCISNSSPFWWMMKILGQRKCCITHGLLYSADIITGCTARCPTLSISFKYPTRHTSYPNVFCYKTLHVSGILSAHHQEFSAVHSALVSFMQVFDDRFQTESGWNSVPP